MIEQLREILLEARELGYLGPGDPSRHLEHARGFVDVAQRSLGREPTRYVDLGTGGGVPGLVLMLAWPASSGVFVESSQRRCADLRRWIGALHGDDRVTIVEARAEDAANLANLRDSAEIVTARGFAPPPVTAEIGSAFLAVGGYLVVSDPPDALPNRWPAEELARLGLGPAAAITARGAHYVAIKKSSSTLRGVPRRKNRPWKHPLWRCST